MSRWCLLEDQVELLAVEFGLEIDLKKPADLEAEIMGTVNTLGVGPMGFGGRISLIGCKVGVQNRLPASFFVSIAYDCWAFRRLGIRLDATTGTIAGM